MVIRNSRGLKLFFCNLYTENPKLIVIYNISSLNDLGLKD